MKGVYMAIGKNIKLLRERFGYSQNELAKLTGISQALIWYYEHEDKMPSVKNADKLAKVFNITIDELLYGEKRA